MSILVGVAAAVLYLAAPIWFLLRGYQLIPAGLSMLLGATLPLIFEPAEYDGPANGLLLVMLLPLPILVIGAGVVAALFKVVRGRAPQRRA